MNLIAAIREFYDFLTRILYYSFFSEKRISTQDNALKQPQQEVMLYSNTAVLLQQNTQLPSDEQNQAEKETLLNENNSEITDLEKAIIRQLENEIACLIREEIQQKARIDQLKQEIAELDAINAQAEEDAKLVERPPAALLYDAARIEQRKSAVAISWGLPLSAEQSSESELIPTTLIVRQPEQLDYVQQAIQLAQIELALLPLPASENTAQKHNPYVKTKIPSGSQTSKTGEFSSEHFPLKMPVSTKFSNTADEKHTMPEEAWFLFFMLVEIITEHLEETIRPPRRARYDIPPEEPIYLCLKTGKKIAAPAPQTAPAVSSIKEQVHGFFRSFTIRDTVHQACSTQPLPQAKSMTALSEDTPFPAPYFKR